MRRSTTTAYVWPDLIRPATVRLVYLDLNHWVALAKASVGHSQGQQHVAALEALRGFRAAGDVFPLCATHFMEVAGIKNRRHRVDLAAIMEELSGFDVLVSRAVVQELELSATLDIFGRPLGVALPPVPLLGRGVMRAFGMIGGLKFRNQAGDDVTADAREAFRDGPEAFDLWREEGERALDRAMIAGPKDEAEERKLRADGWDPMAGRRIHDDNAAVERELVKLLTADPHWRRQRIRDVVSARHVWLEFREKLQEGLDARGLVLEDVCGDQDAVRRFIDAMPSADVCVSLKSRAHRNPQTEWTRNRIHDIDQMSVAVPYCDVVAADTEVVHALHVEGVPERLGTTVVSTLDALVDALV